MKKYYLSQNQVTQEYYLDESKFDNERTIINGNFECENVEKLRNILDTNRKTILYLVEPFDKTLEDCIKSFFKDSRIIAGRTTLKK